jgi:hypothetical protein
MDCTGVAKVEPITISFKLVSAASGTDRTSQKNIGETVAGDLVLTVADAKADIAVIALGCCPSRFSPISSCEKHAGGRRTSGGGGIGTGESPARREEAGAACRTGASPAVWRW